MVGEFREEAEKIEAPGHAALGESATLEVEAWELAFNDDWIAASQKLEDAARAVGKGGDATRGYRGLLLYLAGAWLHLGAESEAHRAHSRELIRNAAKASVRGTWLKEMKELPGAEEVPLAAADAVAVNNLVARLTGNFKANKIKENLAESVGRDEAVAYEVGLTNLGNFLGPRLPAERAGKGVHWRGAGTRRCG